MTTSSASARAPNRLHVIPTKVYCTSASLDALPRQRNRRSTHDDINATTSSSFLTLVIGSMTNRATANRATANRCYFHTNSYDRLDGWCELSQIPRRMHMEHQNLIGHPRQSHDDHMVNSVQLPQNFAGPVESTNMRPKCIDIGSRTDVTASILDSWSTQPPLKTSSVVTYTPLHYVPFENKSCSCLNDSWFLSFSLMLVPVSRL